MEQEQKAGKISRRDFLKIPLLIGGGLLAERLGGGICFADPEGPIKLPKSRKEKLKLPQEEVVESFYAVYQAYTFTFEDGEIGKVTTQTPFAEATTLYPYPRRFFSAGSYSSKMTPKEAQEVAAEAVESGQLLELINQNLQNYESLKNSWRPHMAAAAVNLSH